MTAYAIAHLHNLSEHPDIVEYLERIDATLTPFSGRFIIHGATAQAVEGEWPGGVVAIEFPSVAEAEKWYHSSAYQEIRALRTDHITSDVIIVDGVEPGHESGLLAAALSREAHRVTK